MDIRGPHSEQWDVVERLMIENGLSERFVTELAPELWDAAETHGLDGVGVLAQSWKETDGGKFTGTVPPWFHNTCGLKVHPDEQKAIPDGLAAGDAIWAHQRFAGWRWGAIAQVQHLRAYMGFPVKRRDVIAPRTLYVMDRGLTRVLQWENLTRWAGVDYGKQVVTLARRLIQIGT